MMLCTASRDALSPPPWPPAPSATTQHRLLSALGVAEDQLLIGVSAEPWVLQAGDVFLLCTDGLWEYVAVTAIEAALAQAPDPQAWLDDLEQQVLAAAAHKPNHDNFSALTVWVSEH